MTMPKRGSVRYLRVLQSSIACLAHPCCAAQEIKSGQEEITVLRKRLREAERIRANKRRYDEIAAKIFELPSREKSIE